MPISLVFLVSLIFGLVTIGALITFNISIKNCIVLSALGFVLVFFFIEIGNYSCSVNDVYNIKTVYRTNLIANSQMTKTLMDKTLVKTEYKNLMADLANNGKSSEMMKSYNGLFSEMTDYNKKVAKYLYSKEHPILFLLDNGPVPNVDGLTMITLADLGL